MGLVPISQIDHWLRLVFGWVNIGIYGRWLIGEEDGMDNDEIVDGGRLMGVEGEWRMDEKKLT